MSLEMGESSKMVKNGFVTTTATDAYVLASMFLQFCDFAIFAFFTSFTEMIRILLQEEKVTSPNWRLDTFTSWEHNARLTLNPKVILDGLSSFHP